LNRVELSNGITSVSRENCPDEISLVTSACNFVYRNDINRYIREICHTK